MQYLENVINEEEIEIFKNYWEKNNSQSYINGATGDYSPAKKFSDYQDRRLLIVEGTRSHNILRRVVDSFFPVDTPFWANYQRQSAPPQLHVDEFGRDRTSPTWTIIMAVDTVPEFKAIIFKELANDGDAAFEIVRSRIDSRMPKISNISETEALDHALYGPIDDTGIIPNMCDWLEVDGIFQYKAGCACLFDTNQLHITNYWRRYPQFEYRDLVQLHIGVGSSGNSGEERRKGDLIPNAHTLQIVD
jgi:hypothetical protein